MRNMGIIHHALFRNGNSGLQCAYFVNNDLQSASVNRHFLNIIIRWCKFCNNDLSFFLGNGQGQANVETREVLKLTRIEHQFNCWLSFSLSLNFLVYFAKMSIYFSMKTNRKKVSRRVLQNIFSNWQYFTSECLYD